MKKLFAEFKAFAFKSNVLDLAIAVIMGGAVGKVVTALVDSILMPLIGILLGGINFSALSITVGNASIQYGAFIQALVDFVIVAFCIFIIMNALKKMAPPKTDEPTKPTTDELLTEIRDLLAKTFQ